MLFLVSFLSLLSLSLQGADKLTSTLLMGGPSQPAGAPCGRNFAEATNGCYKRIPSGDGTMSASRLAWRPLQGLSSI